jgi:hypothetical protein
MRLMLALVRTDLRNITREPLLAALILMPLLVALIYRFVLPDAAELAALARGSLAADLEPHRAWLIRVADAMGPLLMTVFVGMTPGLVGGVYGLLLVDERDERTLAVIRVTPAPFAQYLTARLLAPCALSLLMTIAAYPIAGLAPLPLAAVAAIAAAGVPIAPLVTLAIAAFAPNKVAGLALLRVVTTLLALPILAYFATPAQAMLAWPVPSYWQMKALWLAVNGQDFAGALVLTVVLSAPLIVWLYRRFARRSEG